MPHISALLLLLPLLLFPQTALAETATDAPIRRFTVAVPQDVLRDYFLFLDGRDPLTITDYSGPHSRRDVIEVVLFQQALALGGISQRPVFDTIPAYSRILEELDSGRTAALGTPAWRSDLTRSQNVLITSPLVRDGQFEAGLYTAPDNTNALNSDTPKKLQQLCATCNRSWKRDWETLKALGIHNIHFVSQWMNMVRLVHSRRVDFLLAPFQPTGDLSLEVDGMTLLPIPGIKVGLAGSRHFAVARKHPDGQRIFKALQTGLAAMRSKGVLCKAYDQCGFFNAQTRGWLRLSAPGVIAKAHDESPDHNIQQ